MKLGIVKDTTNGFELPTGGIQQGLSKSEDVNILPILSSEQLSNLYKPYQLKQANELLDKLSNQEFLENNYLLLEKSLEGLHRIENYYKINSKDRIYELLKNKLENKKIINNAFNNSLVNFKYIYKSPVINFFSKNNKKIL
jgi:hypothetical protein